MTVHCVDKMTSSGSKFERLPTIYDPKVYNLVLYPNASDSSFCGKVQINMLVKEPTNNFVLNYKKIEILSAEAKYNSSTGTMIY